MVVRAKWLRGNGSSETQTAGSVHLCDLVRMKAIADWTVDKIQCVLTVLKVGERERELREYTRLHRATERSRAVRQCPGRRACTTQASQARFKQVLGGSGWRSFIGRD